MPGRRHFPGRAVLWSVSEAVGGKILFHPQAVSVTSLVALLLLVWALQDLQFLHGIIT